MRWAVVQAHSAVLLSEPLIGGVALGRLEAVETLLDYPECDPGSPITPREINLQYDVASAHTPHSQIEIADTIDALAIRAGVAEVRGRDDGIWSR